MPSTSLLHEIKWRILGVLAFSIAGYSVLYYQCQEAGPKLCYFSPDAWRYIPAMLAVPAIVVQAISWPLLRLQNINRIGNKTAHILIHAVIAFVILRFWLLITGQWWWFLPSANDLFIVFGGVLMGGVLAFSPSALTHHSRGTR